MSLLHKKVSIRAVVSSKGNIPRQLDAVLLLFTKVDWAGTREAISAFLKCPLLRRPLALDPVVDTLWEKGLIQVGPRIGDKSHLSFPLNMDEPFRRNSLLYLSKLGTEYAKEKLRRVRATYGWRSTDSDAHGVKRKKKVSCKSCGDFMWLYSPMSCVASSDDFIPCGDCNPSARIPSGGVPIDSVMAWGGAQ